MNTKLANLAMIAGLVAASSGSIYSRSPNRFTAKPAGQNKRKQKRKNQRVARRNNR